MFIHKLHLQNFRNINDISIEDFSPINVITGNNGQGKSSIVDAIIFCLTNTLQDKMEEYVQWGRKKASIYIEFSLHNHIYDYRIEINKKGGTNRVLIIDNNDDEYYTKSDAVKKLQEVIDPVLTLYSAISIQHRSTELLFDTPANRLQKIKSLLRIDSIDEVVNSIKEDIKTNKDDISKLQGEIDALESQKFEYEVEPVLPSIDVNGYKKEIKILEEEREEYTKKYGEYQTYLSEVAQYTSAQKKLENAVDRKKELEGQIKRLPRYDKHKHEDYLNSLYDLNNEINDLLNELSISKNIDSQIDTIEKELEALHPLRVKACEFDEKYLEDLAYETIKLGTDIETLEEKIKYAREGNCPVCGEPFKSSPEEFESKKNELQTELDKKVEELREGRSEYAAYIDARDQNKLILEKRSMHEENLNHWKNEGSKHKGTADVETELDTKKLEKEEIQRTIEEMEIRKEKYEEVKSINAEIEKELFSIDERIKELKEVKEPEKVEEPVQPDTDKLERLKDELNEYTYTLKEIKGVQERNEAVKKREKEVQDKIKKSKEKVHKLSSDNKLLKDVQKVISKDFTVYLINKASNLIKKNMNHFFSTAYSGKYEIEFEQYSSGIEFYFSSIEDEELHPVSMLSGYERQLFAISFRLALSKLQNLGILVLDEIDESGSAENSLKLYELLLNEPIEQIFCVSHHPETVEYISNKSNAKAFEIANGSII